MTQNELLVQFLTHFVLEKVGLHWRLLVQTGF